MKMSNWQTIDKNGIFCKLCGEKIYYQESYPYLIKDEHGIATKRICEKCNDLDRKKDYES
jgi:hypothetical protein